MLYTMLLSTKFMQLLSLFLYVHSMFSDSFLSGQKETSKFMAILFSW